MSTKSSDSTPATLKSKAIGLFWGGLIIALGVWMLSRPDNPYFHPEDAVRAKTRLVETVINWIWGIPGGIVLAIIGIMVIGGSFMPSKPGDDDE